MPGMAIRNWLVRLMDEPGMGAAKGKEEVFLGAGQPADFHARTSHAAVTKQASSLATMQARELRLAIEIERHPFYTRNGDDVRLDDVNRELRALAAQRSDALQDVRAAKGSDVALHRARMIESGQLGAQIREASAALERAGRTVQGTGTLGRPVAGHVTSPFGMRVHPILRHTKLHTGTDFAGGSPAILAADDGRVLMTVAAGQVAYRLRSFSLGVAA